MARKIPKSSTSEGVNDPVNNTEYVGL